jgi:hypothetical protein
MEWRLPRSQWKGQGPKGNRLAIQMCVSSGLVPGILVPGRPRGRLVLDLTARRIGRPEGGGEFLGRRAGFVAVTDGGSRLEITGYTEGNCVMRYFIEGEARVR